MMAAAQLHRPAEPGQGSDVAAAPTLQPPPLPVVAKCAEAADSQSPSHEPETAGKAAPFRVNLKLLAP